MSSLRCFRNTNTYTGKAASMKKRIFLMLWTGLLLLILSFCGSPLLTFADSAQNFPAGTVYPVSLQFSVSSGM